MLYAPPKWCILPFSFFFLQNCTHCLFFYSSLGCTFIIYKPDLHGKSDHSSTTKMKSVLRPHRFTQRPERGRADNDRPNQTVSEKNNKRPASLIIHSSIFYFPKGSLHDRGRSASPMNYRTAGSRSSLMQFIDVDKLVKYRQGGGKIEIFFHIFFHLIREFIIMLFSFTVQGWRLRQVTLRLSQSERMCRSYLL